MLLSKTQKLEYAMAEALTYEEWREAAIEHDETSGVDEWVESDESKHFDYQSIRRRLERLRRLRASGDNRRLLYMLNEGIHGNIDGMGRRALYGKAKFGTKRLIMEFVDEVANALEHLASEDADDIPLEERLNFFHRARHCYGCSAFVMSGAGSLLFFHIGAVKAMWQEGVLPDILSGSSGGAIVGSLVATHADDELANLFEPANLVRHVENNRGLLRYLDMFRFEVASVNEVNEALERLLPDLTFQEAYDLSGRHLNVSVAAAEKHQTSRLLNAITTPNVYVREAVMASAAVPGFYPPVKLAAKNDQGQKQPYLRSRTWVDGSISDDMPAKRLTRIYGVNHFIVSQVNPHVFPFVTDPRRGTDLWSIVRTAGSRTAREWLNAGAVMFEKPLSWNPTISRLTKAGLSIMNQDYVGDINILPGTRLFNPMKLLAHKSVEEVVELMRMGEKATWPKIEMIRIQTKIGRTLNEILRRLDHGAMDIARAASRRAG
jgi:NTE family protein